MLTARPYWRCSRLPSTFDQPAVRQRLFHGGHADQLDRLGALAATFDGFIQARLAEARVETGWECLDVGAGTLISRRPPQIDPEPEDDQNIRYMR